MRHFFKLTFLAAFFFSGTVTIAETTVQFNFHNAEVSQLNYFFDEGTGYVEYKVSIGADNSYHLKLDVKEPVFFNYNLGPETKSFGVMVLYPNKKYKVSIDLSDAAICDPEDICRRRGTTTFKGKNSAGMNAYAADPIGAFKYQTKEGDRLKTLDEIDTELAQLEVARIAPFVALAQERKVDETYVEMMREYIGKTFCNERAQIANRRLHWISRDDVKAVTELYAFWETAFDGLLESDNHYKHFGSHSLLQSYIRFNLLKSNQLSYENYDQLVDYFEVSQGLLPNKLRTSFLFHQIKHESIVEYLSFQSLTSFEQFAEEFPTHIALPSLSLMVQKNYSKYHRNLKPLVMKATMVPAHDELDAFHQVKRNFLGVKVLVHFWSPKEGDMKKPFEQLDKLRGLSHAKGFEVLFVAVGDYDVDAVEGFVLDENIRGYHVLANSKLQAEVQRVLAVDNLNEVSRFVAMDKYGTVRNWDLAGPEDGVAMVEGLLQVR